LNCLPAPTLQYRAFPVEPGSTGSLLDVKEFLLGGNLNMLRTLEVIEKKWCAHTPPDEPLADHMVDHFVAMTKLTINILEMNYMHECARTAHRMLVDIEGRKSYVTLGHDARHLRESIEQQLRSMRFLMLHPDKQDWFLGHALKLRSGVNVRMFRLGLSDDLLMACTAYATDQNDACILLLARSMERAVKVLAQKLRIKLTHHNPASAKSWAVLMDQVHKKLKDMEQTKRSKAAMLRLEQMSSVASHLSNARIAWRNAPVHSNEDENVIEAKTKAILDATINLLQELAMV
jgi:hypothetical protein